MRSKREKFIELAEKRVNNALKQLDLIGNLSNRSNYEYDESDYKRIFNAIDSGVKSMRNRFLEVNKKRERKFKLRK